MRETRSGEEESESRTLSSKGRPTTGEQTAFSLTSLAFKKNILRQTDELLVSFVVFFIEYLISFYFVCFWVYLFFCNNINSHLFILKQTTLGCKKISTNELNLHGKKTFF